MTEHRIKYPFVRDTYTALEEDGPCDSPTWRPGTRNELRGPDGDCDILADGEGFAVFTEISRHKPGRFPTRVFYTRKFIDPDGREFGKGRLHIATAEKFGRLTKGFQYGYDVHGES